MDVGEASETLLISNSGEAWREIMRNAGLVGLIVRCADA